MVNCELKTERDTTCLDCVVVNKQPKDRNVRTKLKPNYILGDVEFEWFGGWRRAGRGRGGRRLFFSTEFRKMCVHLKKSWLRP